MVLLFRLLFEMPNKGAEDIDAALFNGGLFGQHVLRSIAVCVVGMAAGRQIKMLCVFLLPLPLGPQTLQR